MTAVKEPRVTNRWKFDAPKVNLKYDIPIQANMQMTLVNNEDVETMGKGLMLAVPGVFPTSHHSYCLRHLKINFREAITDLYRQAYAAAILSVVGGQRMEGEEGDILIKPPLTKIRPGRKKKNRIQPQADPDSVSLYRCSRCKGLGHNRKTCRNPVA
ncbi:hypothetical protein QJS04_geneDACA019954 [Acorus gramineus]|uniref:CCHC-type domain-containing protein n=1 Tax=Acorus gramineus TaxID=55184 RepID=A0AAV8ZY66_ACOGR|nr:hypothetical protein QJS04_geneDACA019954 [Acorus gramineus]